MPEDTFLIRIKRDGTIYFGARELGPERLRLLRELLEDSLGKVEQRVAEDADTPPAPYVQIVDEEKVKQNRE